MSKFVEISDPDASGVSKFLEAKARGTKIPYLPDIRSGVVLNVSETNKLHIAERF